MPSRPSAVSARRAMARASSSIGGGAVGRKPGLGVRQRQRRGLRREDQVAHADQRQAGPGGRAVDGGDERRVGARKARDRPVQVGGDLQQVRAQPLAQGAKRREVPADASRFATASRAKVMLSKLMDPRQPRTFRCDQTGVAHPSTPGVAPRPTVVFPR